MGIINFIISLFMVTFFVVAISMICTLPSWLAGRWHWSEERRPKATFLTETPTRRWCLWIASSLTALVGLSMLFSLKPGSLSPLGGITFIAGAIAAQHFAFLIGFADVDRKHAHRNPHLYSALPEGLGPQHLSRRADEVHTQPLPIGETDEGRGLVLGESTAATAPRGADLSTPEYPMAEPRQD